MATTADSSAVKSLNQGPGRQRFVFKKFADRIEDIEIDVYRSLHPVQAEPTEGSCFIRDCIIEWRELNTAEDFTEVCSEITPLVQNLPLVLLHKESILKKLLSRLKMKARLSLEPILRLIAALSRDLLEEFLPFLRCVVKSIVSLLQDGADGQPDIIEQIFTSWSLILMHLQKYLLRDLIYVLKVTARLRYYHKGYVQEFMAEAMGFLLRNAPVDQLIKGIKKVMIEVAKEPPEKANGVTALLTPENKNEVSALLMSEKKSAVSALDMPEKKNGLSALLTHEKKNGVSALLYYVMRGSSSRFHSKAATVLQILISSTMDKTCIH